MEQDTKPHFFFLGHTFKGLVTNRKKSMDSRRNSLSPFLKSKKNVCYQLYGSRKKGSAPFGFNYSQNSLQMTGEDPMVLPCCSVLGRTRFSAAWEHAEVETTFSPLLSQLPGLSLRVPNSSRAGSFQVCHVTWHQCSCRCT